ncbi:MAG: hypothetical protein Q8P51_02075 [Ignavibacteria bacterium]|nr:hypothetical protein [Ignavibacteria bacterium]
MKAALGMMGACSLIILLSQFGCKDNGTNPPPGNGPPPPRAGCPFKHVEADDTTREYKTWDGTVYELSRSYVFARFVEGTADSVAFAIASNYGLRRRFHAGGVWVFCVPEGRRAEEFFTPYGKPKNQTFGNEELVDVAYAVFQDGLFGYLDELLVQFDSTVARTQIDSINSLYSVVVNRTFAIAERPWYNLRLTKKSPYACFDMIHLYHCLPEVQLVGPNSSSFNPPLGPQCKANR